ncbi:MAG TPA: alanine--glyoxylate aminotransferase family protein [Elusimicrobiota bacterium]|nr:alanine--glyoxylate aminotransferase family protein [Elusimicrobiota bacterium]
MKKLYMMTPGPTPIPPEVSAQEGLPILHHRTSEFSAIFGEVIKDLKHVFQTQNDVLIMSSSGTGALESSVANLLSPGDTALVASAGVFGDRFIKIQEAYGVKTLVIRAPDGQVVDPEKIREALKKNPDIKTVFTTHTETSTGVVNDIRAIGKVVAPTPAILVVDAVSGLAGQDLQTDAWNIDVVCTGSQKGFMTAPGLAMVSLSPKAIPFVDSAKCPRFYFDYRKMRKTVTENQTPFTPPVTLLVAMAEALRQIRKEGLSNALARHEWLAKATRAGVQALGLKIFAQVPCNVLTSITVPDGVNGKAIVKRMREEYGVSIAGGQGDLVGKIIRIAHMGYMDRFDVVIALAGLEMILADMGSKIELGKGVAAAQRILITKPGAPAPAAKAAPATAGAR